MLEAEAIAFAVDAYGGAQGKGGGAGGAFAEGKGGGTRGAVGGKGGGSGGVEETGSSDGGGAEGMPELLRWLVIVGWGIGTA